MDDQTITFDKKIISLGESSLATTLPPEIIKYLELETGTEIKIQPLIGKHGKYIAIWKKQDTTQK